MRVLHVVASDERRGAELFAADLVGALDGRGVVQRVALLRRLEGPRVVFAAPTDLLGGGRTLPGLRVDLRAMRALRRLLREWRPDVVQVHGGEALKHAVPAGRGSRLPIVYRKIGLTSRVGRLRRSLHGALMRRAAAVVAVGDAVRREVVEAFRVPPSRVVSLPNGVDLRRVRPAGSREHLRRALGVGDAPAVVLSVGALAWEKDPLAHLQVLAPLLRERPGIVYLVAGDGPMRGAVEADVRRHGLDGNVRLLGSRTDVPDLMAAADVLLLASRTEGMPGTLIEAGLSGLPVVAPDIAGVPEVVRHGDTGLLAAAGDLDGLRAHVASLLRDVGTRRDMGERARRWCRGRFDIARVAPGYLRLYERLVGGR